MSLLKHNECKFKFLLFLAEAEYLQGCTKNGKELGKGHKSDDWWIEKFDSLENQPWSLIWKGLAAVRCCSDEYPVSLNCASRNSSGDCFGYGATFAEAKSICKADNRRLCRSDEIDNDICCGSGCEYDRMFAWVNNSKCISI